MYEVVCAAPEHGRRAVMLVIVPRRAYGVQRAPRGSHVLHGHGRDDSLVRLS